MRGVVQFRFRLGVGRVADIADDRRQPDMGHRLRAGLDRRHRADRAVLVGRDGKARFLRQI